VRKCLFEEPRCPGTLLARTGPEDAVLCIYLLVRYPGIVRLAALRRDPQLVKDLARRFEGEVLAAAETFGDVLQYFPVSTLHRAGRSPG
jgi:hypothetical protein